MQKQKVMVDAGIERAEEERGVAILLTGNGKGKTTAALGTAVRHAGYGRKVLIIQFIKGTWHYGELDALAKIPCPTLVVRGAASDFLSPEIADKMVDEVLPSGQLAIVPQAGHSVMSDNPEGFCRVVTDFAVSE